MYNKDRCRAIGGMEQQGSNSVQEQQSKISSQKRPLYQKIVGKLLAQLDKQSIKRGDPLPSEFILSQQYDVSRTTIRKALAELTWQGTLVTVPGKGTFVNHQKKKFVVTAERLRRKTIGYVVPDIGDPFVASIHRGIISQARELGYSVAIYSSNMSREVEESNIQLLLDRTEVGAIIFPPLGHGATKSIQSLKQYGYPMVLVDRFFEDVPTDFVGTDNFQGAFEAVSALVKWGHRRIGHIKGISSSANDERYRGYRQALVTAGIEADEELVVEQEASKDGLDPTAGGSDEMLKLMGLPSSPTAVFAANDPLALGAAKAACDLGLQVGVDVALMGFDDLGIGALAPVALSTVHQPAEEIGKAAVQMLIESVKYITVGKKNRLHHTKLMPQLIVRESAHPPKATESTAEALSREFVDTRTGAER